MLADIIAAYDPDNLLRRVAWHESGHVVAALYYKLPLREVRICDDGTGLTSYQHWLGLAECERWTITTFAGGEAEFDLFGDWRADNGDLRAIGNMLYALQLSWGDDKLAELRRQARRLVKRERGHIGMMADALLRHRYLTLAALRGYGF